MNLLLVSAVLIAQQSVNLPYYSMPPAPIEYVTLEKPMVTVSLPESYQLTNVAGPFWHRAYTYKTESGVVFTTKKAIKGVKDSRAYEIAHPKKAWCQEWCKRWEPVAAFAATTASIGTFCAANFKILQGKKLF